MYRLTYYYRWALSLGYLALFISMVVGGYWYAAIAAFLVMFFIFTPLLLFHRNTRKPVFIPLTWSAMPSPVLLRWVRKGTAALSCCLVIGAIQRQYYEAGFLIAGFCALFLSPVDKWLFGPPTKYESAHPWRSVRFVSIVVGRNYGVLLFVFQLSKYLEGTAPKMHIIGMAMGLLLMSLRPAWAILAPERPPDTMAPIPATATTEPLSSTSSIKEAEQEPPLPADSPEPLPPPDLAALKIAYQALQQLPSQARGFAFQRFLHDLFSAHHLISRTAFRLTGEEIDGSFDIGLHTWLLEAKWQTTPTPQSDLLVFNSKVEGKSTWARGIFISYAGFTRDGQVAFRHGKRTSIIGMDGSDLQLILDGIISLEEAIKLKSFKAVENNDFFVSLSELL